MKPEPPKTVAVRAIALVTLARCRQAALPPRAPPPGRRYTTGRTPLQPEKPLTLRSASPISRPSEAQVAELVDAQVSGTCGRKVVEVRVFSWAPSSLGRPRLTAGRNA